MRIALVANSTWNIYNFRLNVLKKLLAEGHEIIVIAPVDAYIEYMEKYPQVQHIALRSLGRDSKNPLRDLVLIEEFRRKFKRLKPDLIITYTHKPNIYGGIAARIVGIPTVAMVTGLGYAFLHNGIINRITKALYRLSSKHHSKVIFENIDDRLMFVEQGLITKEQGVSIKGCGVDINHFAPRPNGELREKTVFTFIGRLLYDKGIVEFVEAAKAIKAKHKNVEFWVIGELDAQNPSMVNNEDLLHWIETNIIDYHGFIRDVRPFIQKSDCIVLPSYREAIPRTITEAMAMAKPVITTDTAGCRESVEVGKNGFLATVRDAISLTDKIDQFLQLSHDDHVKMGQYGRQKAEREFDDRKIANDIYQIIRPFLGKENT